ncbi:uncharacterized protein LOC124405905 [Diprion similis]|uniref:uncharacterized protein LOC124405905 n=1 Tax=Diprion similis TaxID=362088 RepID=UPI001EF9B029|nr:uncharacterized protein LOC124405905 [Diprion similis]
MSPIDTVPIQISPWKPVKIADLGPRYERMDVIRTSNMWRLFLGHTFNYRSWQGDSLFVPVRLRRIENLLTLLGEDILDPTPAPEVVTHFAKTFTSSVENLTLNATFLLMHICLTSLYNTMLRTCGKHDCVPSNRIASSILFARKTRPRLRCDTLKFFQYSPRARNITGGKQTLEITLAELMDDGIEIEDKVNENSGKVSLELTTVRQKPKMDATIFNLLFDHQIHLDKPADLRCKGCHVDVFMLEALNNSMKKFSTLTTLKLQRCFIDAFGIVKIAEMLAEPSSTIKDLNLDMNPNTKQNHHFLCAARTKLLYLSLKICEINDDGVAKIASNLSHHDESCTSSLIVLNLANNTISQIGAEKIGNMLRTNRSLQSLTLTGNKINDAGVKCILDQLSPFTLTHAEVVEKRWRKINRLKLRKEKMDNLSSLALRSGSTVSESKERGRDSRISKKRRGSD